MSHVGFNVIGSSWKKDMAARLAAKFLRLSLGSAAAFAKPHLRVSAPPVLRPVALAPDGETDNDSSVESDETGSAPRPRYSTRRSGDIEARYLSELQRKPRLTKNEEYKLAVRMKAGDIDAHDALIEANLGLVVMFARRYRPTGVPLMDLIAEGNLGLIKAARRFDPELGYRFATYAKWWVRQAIQLALPKLIGVVRMPASQLARRPLASQGAAPSSSGSEDEMLSVFNVGWADQDSEEGLELLVESMCGSVCVHVDLDDEQALEAITIPAELEPPGVALSVQRAAVLQRALSTLSERDRIVISERFALVNDRCCTLEELSKRFQVSIERIRQIENAAVKKLGRALVDAGESAYTML